MIAQTWLALPGLLIIWCLVAADGFDYKLAMSVATVQEHKRNDLPVG